MNTSSIVENLFSYYREIGSLDDVQYIKTEQFESIRTKTGSWPNMIFNVSKEISFSDIILQIKDQIIKDKLPPFIIFDYVNNYVVDHEFLSTNDFKPVMFWKGMHLLVNEFLSSNRKIENFETKKIQSFDDAQSFVSVLNNTLLARNKANDSLFYELSKNKNFNFFLGKLENNSVATSVNYIKDNIAGLYMIATLEANRGKGMGTQITIDAINDAMHKNATEIILHATKLGEKIYSKLGFKQQCNLYIYWLMEKQ